MKILLIYPRYPETFWSFRHALKFIGKKEAFPPLGLLTVASMLPKEWEKKLINENIRSIKNKDIKWADFVFISAMIVQKKSVKEIIKRCKKLGTKVVAGGPLFTTGYQEFNDVDYFVLNEAEITLPLFLEDLKKGRLEHIYTSEEKPDLSKTLIPQWNLINFKDYATMSIQYSRGCPFNCDFCDITLLYGRRQRTKSKEQIKKELDALYNQGWRGEVFFVDDNFIGNKEKLKKEILPTIIKWQEEKNYPFLLNTEASINLVDDEKLMNMMVKSGFNTVFVGIETPNEESLAEANKIQNKNRDLVANIKKIQSYGLQVQGGFIMGFDSDPPSIFKKQIDFIQKSGVVVAMVGLLNALPHTRLWKRLKASGRLIKDTSGDNTDGSINFIPEMNRQKLVNGYRNVLKTIYSSKYHCQRIITFLKQYKRLKINKKFRFHLRFYHIKALLKSIWFLGIKEKGRLYYWKLFFWSLLNCPQFFPLAITLSIYGFHFRKISEKQ